MIIYGIKNCDKVRAAIKKCQFEGIAVQLHDFRVDGIDLTLVNDMLKDIDMTQLLNKRSTTWKQLPEAQRENVDASTLAENPTLIKRPVIYDQGLYRIGL